MPFRKYQKRRILRPIRVLSLALGSLGIILSIVLIGFVKANPHPPPIFRYAILTFPWPVWIVAFALAGGFVLTANIVHRWAHLAHSVGVGVYTVWGVVLTIATIDPGVVTSGYSFAMLIAALGHWVCAAYWDAENPRVAK